MPRSSCVTVAVQAELAEAHRAAETERHAHALALEQQVRGGRRRWGLLQQLTGEGWGATPTPWPLSRRCGNGLMGCDSGNLYPNEWRLIQQLNGEGGSARPMPWPLSSRYGKGLVDRLSSRE